MAMVVRSNMNAMNANRNLSINNGQVAKSLEKLASGYAINRAGDDAAGLAISEKMKAQIKGLEQASDNSQDGISLIQTAEGGMNEIHDMLNRMVELATKSANGTIQDEVDRDAIQLEVDALLEEIDRIVDATNFNGIDLLNGNLESGFSGSKDIAVAAEDAVALSDFAISSTGTETAVTVATAGKATTALTTGGISNANLSAGETVTVAWTDENGEAQSETFSYSTADANNGDIKFTSTTGTASFTASASDGVNVNNGAALAVGYEEFLNDLGFALGTGGEISMGGATNVTITASGTNFLAATSSTAYAAGDNTGDVIAGGGDVMYDLTSGDTITVDDVEYAVDDYASVGDMFDAIAADTGLTVVTDSTGTVTGYALADSKAIEASEATEAIEGTALTLQVGDTYDPYNKVSVDIKSLDTESMGVGKLDVSDQDVAGEAIDTIKSAINYVSNERANLGALQNRLEYTINNLDNTAENMTSANSTIRDTDMASEMMEYTKMNVLVQSAQSMLAQANQAPQQILSLLG